MKTKIAIVSLALASYAGAADFYITGATAFRAGSVKAISAAFSGAFTAGYYDASASNHSTQKATYSVFSGTISGITGTSNIYCTWTGSVEGIKALALNEDVQFLTTAPTTAGTAAGAGGSLLASTTSGKKAQLAFSDVFKSSTPYGSATLYPSNAKVGVITFAWVKSEGSNANLLNITGQSARAIFTAGVQDLQLFTGTAADAGNLVYLTGRNDGSGTRTTFLAETGYPISSTVTQYKVTGNATTTSSIAAWPTGDGNNASTIWNSDTEGNGGYFSGSGLTTALGATSASVSVNGETAAPISIIGYQSTADAANSVAAGASLLKYNGASVSLSGTALSADFRASVTNGGYTMWGYEHLYSKTDIKTPPIPPADDVNRLYNTIKAGLTASVLGNTGIPAGELTVGRATDGDTVAP